MVSNGIVATYSLHLSPCGQRGVGLTFTDRGIAHGDMVSDECGLFKGPRGGTLSLILQPPVGMLSGSHATA